MPSNPVFFGCSVAPAQYAPGEDEPQGMMWISGKRGDSTKGTIETMEVGDYVTTYTHEERGDRLPIDDIQGKWMARQRIRLHLDKENGGHSLIVLLREAKWVRSEKITVGGSVYLNMSEMGCVGHARVEAVETCMVFLRWVNSSIRMVTGTFKHSEGLCGDLRLKGESKPIGVTPGHPFWSEDRQDWVSVRNLVLGETVKTLKGTTTVESYTICDKPEPTFNMEVEGDHCYRVGEQGVLVHNVSESCHLFPKSFSGGWDIPKINPPIVGTGGRVEGIEARINKVVNTDRPDLENPKCWQTCWNQDLPKGKSKVARCHLLGHVLGGSSNQDNLVPCCQKANLEQWNVAEKQIRDYIRDNPGAVVDIKVTVHYGMSPAACPIPTGMTLVGKGSVCGASCKDFASSIRNPANLNDCPV